MDTSYNPLTVVEDWHPVAPDPIKQTVQSGYGAEAQVVTVQPTKCDHFFYRYNATDIRCSNCPTGWIDEGKFIIEDGKILGKRE